MFKFILLLFVIGMVLRALSRYIFPIFRITSVVNGRMRQMQDQVNEMDRKVNDNISRNKSKKEGDYIDYEEVPRSGKGSR